MLVDIHLTMTIPMSHTPVALSGPLSMIYHGRILWLLLKTAWSLEYLCQDNLIKRQPRPSDAGKGQACALIRRFSVSYRMGQ